MEDNPEGNTSPTQLAMDEIDKIAGGSIETTYIQRLSLLKVKRI